MNSRALYTPMQPTNPQTPLLQDMATPKVHRGFYRYLHADSHRTEDTSKFDNILAKVKATLRQHEGYELFISGHSLGGALCQLFAFELAALDDDDIPKPIRAISFASPQVGHTSYATAFRKLEEAGRLRHLRITNQGDAVPEMPFGFGYTQTGVNVHVRHDATAQVGYGVVKNIVSQTRWNSGDMHSLGVYENRLFNDWNTELLAETMDELYASEANILPPN